MRRRNLARACGISAHADFKSRGSFVNMEDLDTWYNSAHQFDSSYFHGKSITFEIEDHELTVARLTDGAYDISYNY